MEAVRWLARGEDALPADGDWLAPGEAARVTTLRYPKRRTEYLLRRLAAKHAVAAVTGLPTDRRTLARIEVGNAPSGAPFVLVDGGSTGIEISLTDRAGLAVCAVAPAGRPAGCDIELVEPRSAAFVRDYLTVAERRLIAERCLVADPDGAQTANVIWSAKESALKMLRVGLARDPRSVEVSVASPGPDGWGRLEVRLTENRRATGDGDAADGRSAAEGRRAGGWWRRDGAFVFTVVAARPGPAPVALEDPQALAAATPCHSWLNRF